MCPSIAPINLFKLLPFTPTALNSKAQRREAHAGVLIGHMFEPQRGSTNNFQYALGLIQCGTPVGVRYLLSISTQCALCDTGLWSGTAVQFFEVWLEKMADRNVRPPLTLVPAKPDLATKGSVVNKSPPSSTFRRNSFHPPTSKSKHSQFLIPNWRQRRLCAFVPFSLSLFLIRALGRLSPLFVLSVFSVVNLLQILSILSIHVQFPQSFDWNLWRSS